MGFSDFPLEIKCL